MDNKNEAFFDIKLSLNTLRKIKQLEFSEYSDNSKKAELHKNLLQIDSNGLLPLTKNNLLEFVEVINNVIDTLILENENTEYLETLNTSSISFSSNVKIIEELEDIDLETHMIISLLQSKYPTLFIDENEVFTEKMKSEIYAQDKMAFLIELNKDPDEKRIFIENLLGELKKITGVDFVIVDEEEAKKIESINNTVIDLASIILGKDFKGDTSIIDEHTIIKDYSDKDFKTPSNIKDSHSSEYLKTIDQIIDEIEQPKIEERAKFIEEARKKGGNILDIDSRVNKKLKNNKPT